MNIGYTVGISNGGAQALKCMPFPAELKLTDRNVTGDAPVLTAARFDLEGVTAALPVNVDNRPIPCALCHAQRTATVSCSVFWLLVSIVATFTVYPLLWLLCIITKV